MDGFEVRSVVEDDDDIVITPATRRYLDAFDAWLKDRTPANEAARLGRLGELRAEDRSKVRPVLTPRERQTLALRCQGLDRDAIAERLCIGAESVKKYSTLIARKVGTSNPYLLALWAAHNGLVSVDPVSTDPGRGT